MADLAPPSALLFSCGVPVIDETTRGDDFGQRLELPTSRVRIRGGPLADWDWQVGLAAAALALQALCMLLAVILYALRKTPPRTPRRRSETPSPALLSASSRREEVDEAGGGTEHDEPPAAGATANSAEANRSGAVDLELGEPKTPDAANGAGNTLAHEPRAHNPRASRHASYGRGALLWFLTHEIVISTFQRLEVRRFTVLAIFVHAWATWALADTLLVRRSSSSDGLPVLKRVPRIAFRGLFFLTVLAGVAILVGESLAFMFVIAQTYQVFTQLVCGVLLLVVPQRLDLVFRVPTAARWLGAALAFHGLAWGMRVADCALGSPNGFYSSFPIGAVSTLAVLRAFYLFYWPSYSVAEAVPLAALDVEAEASPKDVDSPSGIDSSVEVVSKPQSPLTADSELPQANQAGDESALLPTAGAVELVVISRDEKSASSGSSSFGRRSSSGSGSGASVAGAEPQACAAPVAPAGDVHPDAHDLPAIHNIIEEEASADAAVEAHMVTEHDAEEQVRRVSVEYQHRDRVHLVVSADHHSLTVMEDADNSDDEDEAVEVDEEAPEPEKEPLESGSPASAPSPALAPLDLNSESLPPSPACERTFSPSSSVKATPRRSFSQESSDRESLPTIDAGEGDRSLLLSGAPDSPETPSARRRAAPDPPSPSPPASAASAVHEPPARLSLSPTSPHAPLGTIKSVAAPPKSLSVLIPDPDSPSNEGESRDRLAALPPLRASSISPPPSPTFLQLERTLSDNSDFAPLPPRPSSAGNRRRRTLPARSRAPLVPPSTASSAEQEVPKLSPYPKRGSAILRVKNSPVGFVREYPQRSSRSRSNSTAVPQRSPRARSVPSRRRSTSDVGLGEGEGEADDEGLGKPPPPKHVPRPPQSPPPSSGNSLAAEFKNVGVSPPTSPRSRRSSVEAVSNATAAAASPAAQGDEAIRAIAKAEEAELGDPSASAATAVNLPGDRSPPPVKPPRPSASVLQSARAGDGDASPPSPSERTSPGSSPPPRPRKRSISGAKKRKSWTAILAEQQEVLVPSESSAEDPSRIHAALGLAPVSADASAAAAAAPASDGESARRSPYSSRSEPGGLLAELRAAQEADSPVLHMATELGPDVVLGSSPPSPGTPIAVVVESAEIEEFDSVERDRSNTPWVDDLGASVSPVSSGSSLGTLAEIDEEEDEEEEDE